MITPLNPSSSPVTVALNCRILYSASLLLLSHFLTGAAFLSTCNKTPLNGINIGSSSSSFQLVIWFFRSTQAWVFEQAS